MTPENEKAIREEMGIEKDAWRSLHQNLPLSVYDTLLVGLGRIAQANGISPGSFFDDDKNKQFMGPRVLVWEMLVELIRRSENESLRV